MNSEHPNPYTAEEMASEHFQSSPVAINVPVTLHSRNQFTGYIRRDIYEAQAARVAELEQQLKNCTVDLAKLDASRYRRAINIGGVE